MNKIKKYSYWIPSYTIYTNTKKEADNIKEYIESGNDYTAYFFDAMIESTGKYKADPKSAIFKVPFTSDMVKYARPSKTPNIKLEQDDDGVELIDGYGMSVKIGKDISEVRIEFNKNISEDLKEKIFSNMSERARAMLKDDMEYMGPVRARDVQETQTKIVRIIRTLEASGEIVIDRGGAGEELIE
mgnify:CR=1 FL=1